MAQRRGNGFLDIAMHDLRQAQLEKRHIPDSRTERRENRLGIRDVVHRGQQGLGIGPGRTFEPLGHPRITALFFGLFQIVSGHPNRRVPPEQTTGDIFKQPDPVIASTEVGEFV